MNRLLSDTILLVLMNINVMFSANKKTKQLNLFDELTHSRCMRSNISVFDEECTKAFAPLSAIVGVGISFVETYVASDNEIRLVDAVQLAVSLVPLRYPSDNGTADKCTKIIKQACSYFRNNGVEYLSDLDGEMVADFMWLGVARNGFKEPSTSTAGIRQWAIRVLFEILGELEVWSGPDICGETISRYIGRSSRPASTDELTRIQVMSHNVLVPNGDELLVALSLCGASAPEVALVCPEDISVDELVVYLKGENQRANPIHHMAQGVLQKAVEEWPTSVPLTVKFGLPLARAAHSVTVRLNNIVRRAGFGKDKELTGVSIRLGVASQVCQANGLEAAALFLGNQSLDSTAKALRYRWWEHR